MSLPENVQSESTGHTAAHAALKADYDTRHPAALLPTYTGDPIVHLQIHNLLATDHNEMEGGNMPMAEMGSSGHLGAHNTLAHAYNGRS